MISQPPKPCINYNAQATVKHNQSKGAIQYPGLAFVANKTGIYGKAKPSTGKEQAKGTLQQPLAAGTQDVHTYAFYKNSGWKAKKLQKNEYYIACTRITSHENKTAGVELHWSAMY